MATIKFELTEERARGLLHVLDQRIREVQKLHDDSHSGVDRLVYAGAVASLTETRDEIRTRMPMPMSSVEPPLPAPQG